MEVRLHILVILIFQTSDMFKFDTNIVSLSRIQPMMNKGSQKVSLTLIFKVIL